MVADEDDDIVDAAVVVMDVVVGMWLSGTSCEERRSSECQSICRVRFSTNSTYKGKQIFSLVRTFKELSWPYLDR